MAPLPPTLKRRSRPTNPRTHGSPLPSIFVSFFVAFFVFMTDRIWANGLYGIHFFAVFRGPKIHFISALFLIEKTWKSWFLTTPTRVSCMWIFMIFTPSSIISSLKTSKKSYPISNSPHQEKTKKHVFSRFRLLYFCKNRKRLRTYALFWRVYVFCFF